MKNQFTAEGQEPKKVRSAAASLKERQMLKMFFKKKDKNRMSPEQLRRLDKRQLKYVTQRDYENGGEKKIGDSGAVNVNGNDFTVVCFGKTVFSAPLNEVSAGELMDLSGFTASYTNSGGQKISIVARYSDGSVKLSGR